MKKHIQAMFVILAAICSTPFAIAADCVETSKTCMDGPSTKNINGVSVTRECWRYEYVYSCVNPNPTESDRCQELRDQGCYEQKNTCIHQDASGACNAWQKEMFCPDGSTADGVQDCTAKSFCMDGACFDTSYKPNGDLAKTVAILEMGRQMGNYLDVGIFKGVAEGCREGYGGIRDCCDSKPAGEAASLSNQALMSIPVSVVMSGASYAWKYATFKATPYVYDFVTGTFGAGVAGFLGATAPAAAEAASAATTAGTAAAAPAFTLNLSFAGFGWTSGGAAAAGAAGPFGTASTGLGGGFYFSPIGFAIFAAAYIYGELSSCEQPEMMLALKRGADVCDPVPEASYCSQEVLGSCLETRHMFCCYNSVIAKIVNVQGKRQLGIPRAFGERRPNCSALSLEQIQQLDFNNIDLSEFYSSINPGGLSSAEWQKKVDSVQQFQDTRTTDCSRYTGEQKDACINSGKYEEEDQPARMSDRISGDTMASNNNEGFWQSRMQDRIDYSTESGRADVQTPPPGMGYDQ